MAITRPEGYTRIVIAVVVAVLVVSAGLIIVNFDVGNKTTTLSPNPGGSSSTATGSSGSQSSPFTGATPVKVTEDRCGTAYSGFGTMCFPSAYSAGTPQSFDMTTAVRQQNGMAITVFTDYFVVPAAGGNLIGYSMTATNVTMFQGYFDQGANASSLSPSDAVSSLQPFLNMTGNYQSYSGNATAPQPGAYVFLFSVPGPEFNDSVSFLLMDSAAYGNGITVRAWAPQAQQVVVSDYSQDGLSGQTGFQWQQVPITVYSQTPTAVNLTSLSLDSGFVKILPSYLPDVGPAGANATLYLVGVQETNNAYNQYLYIGASGARGLTGDTTLWVEGGSGGRVVSGIAPVNLSADGINGLIYDPPAGSPSSLPVTFSVGGLLQNGTVVPLPSWLKIDFPAQRIILGKIATVATTETLGPGEYFSYIPIYENDSIMTGAPSSSGFHAILRAYNPYYFDVSVDTSAATPAQYGGYTVVLNETIGAQHFTGYMSVYAEQLILPGTPLTTTLSQEISPGEAQ